MINKRRVGRIVSMPIFAVTALVFLSALIVYASALDDISTRSSINVFPSEVFSDTWSNVEALHTQDLYDDSLYQSFSRKNSAYIDGERQVEVMPKPAAAAQKSQGFLQDDGEVVTSSTTVSQDTDDVGDTPQVMDEVNPQMEQGPTEDAPQNDADITFDEPEDTQESTESNEETNETQTDDNIEQPNTTALKTMSIRLSTFLARAIDRLPFVVFTEISTSSDGVAHENSEPQTAEVAELADEDVTTAFLEATTSAEITEFDELNIDEPESAASSTVQEEKFKQKKQSASRYSVVFDGFSVPELEPGEFLDGIDLRLSFAAKLKNTDLVKGKHTLSIERSEGTSWQKIGVLDVADETSNALNGGYFLYSFPHLKRVSELRDVQLRVTYEGDAADLEGLYFDSLWLELNTLRIDKDGLKNRAVGDKLSHLKGASAHTLVSTELDFKRDELPTFSLRYEQQRNKVVQLFRKIFSDNVAEISSVHVLHNGIGEIGIRPQISTTPEGLWTIKISENEKQKMLPGLYTVEISVNEGKRTFEDSFDFQWGLLAINTHQTEYRNGAQVDISLGALSPNGNTVCDALLELYVISPSGYIEKAPVVPSGQCKGNNVIDVPDYTSTYSITEEGTYEMYLERLDENGKVIAHTEDTFIVVDKKAFDLSRVGPTRIYPPAPYPMEITITAGSALDGQLIEKVPADFDVFDTDAIVEEQGTHKTLTWDVTLLAGARKTFSYRFDAPDLSPYLYELGPARFESDRALRDVLVTQPEVTVDTAEELPITSNTDNDSVVGAESVVTDEMDEVVSEVVVSESATTSDEVIVDDSSTSTEPTEVEEDTVIITEDAANEEVDQPVEDIPVVEPVNEETTLVDPQPTVAVTVEQHATSTSTSTPERAESSTGSRVVFEEHRQWQIASDATGNMIVFWDNATSIPTGWSCLSCGSGTFYQRFAIGSSTYNNTGGSTSHTPTVSTSLLASALATVESGSGGPAIVTHSHTLTPTVASGSNLPNYRQLRVIQYTASAGEPANIPTGAIGVFDAAVPSGWTRYSAQDGYYVRGEDTPGTTGGSNTHTHSISGTTGGSTGGTARTRGGGSQTTAATNGHTHTISTTTPTINSEPPYIEVVLGQINATGTAPNGLISMWTDEVPTGWLDVSSEASDPFYNRFLKASTTYGTTGGGTTHIHANMNSVVTSGPNATINGRTGSSGADPNHTHNVNFTSFSTEGNVPPYVSAVFGKKQGTDPVYDQLSYRWYVNADSQTPTDPWPAGVSDLVEREPITATSTVLGNGDELRLRINTHVTNATSTAGTEFTLQYGAGASCAAIGTWNDVGDTSSSTVWRGFDNSSVTDHSTLASTTLASTTVAESYEENGVATGTPSAINVDDVGEWDFVLEQNGADAGTNYCFRMVESDGAPFATYTSYPQVLTNSEPVAPTMYTLFDNEKVASATPWFEFVAIDAEAEDVNYQVQIDNDYDFGSTVINRNTTDHGSQFTNLVLPSDKDPYNHGQRMRFKAQTALTNGTTYYVRVRARDPNGSNAWGDWSTVRSFTIDTSVTASRWFQTRDEQFDTNTLVGLETTGSDSVDLITGSSTGSMTSTSIDFDDGESGTSWGQLYFTETDPSGVIEYRLEYFTSTSSWALIPDADLPGNSSGFTSTTSLLDLNTDDYNQIRIVADFTGSGGSPEVLDWTVEWGFRVLTPTITKLFPNEKVGTTTPVFEFSTTDAQNDNLTYQISWSTDNTFTSSTTRTSNIATSSFANITTPADTDPFTSGDQIQFTVDGADALTNNTTYWWRVRAKDTDGDNTYSFWTSSRSFTVDTSVTVSTWFQTTEEQFLTNILSGTAALASDAVTVATTAREAMLVYGEGVASVPRYRQWNGTAWSAEANMLDVGAPIKHTVVRAGTNREEYVAATIGTDADVNVQVFSTGAWSNLQEVTTSVGDINARGMDVAYETLSGDAIVAYCDGDADPSYYVWDGTSWTSGGTINLSSTNDCEWVALASDPTSDEIIILSRDDSGSQYEAQVWSGSGWGNATIQGSITDAAHEGMSVIYEESGNQAIIVTSDGNPSRFRWNSWNGSTWGTASTQTLGDDLEWIQLARDVGSDEIIACYLDEDVDIGVVRWTGSAWAGQTELDTSGNAKTDPAFSCVFEDVGSRDNYIMTAYSDTAATNYSFWNNSTWSGETQIDTIGDASTMQLERTGDGLVLGVFFDDPNDSLVFSSFDGSGWSTAQTLEDDMSVDTSPFGHPYWIAPRESGKAGTTIVSPGINFSDGLGPYWEEFSWVDVTPGTSDILYSVQYYDSASSTWKFIPDGDLPGNSSGTSTSPIDLSALNVGTYDQLRPYAALSCDEVDNCPELQDWTLTWAEGITVAGSLQKYDQSTNVNSGTVAVAVNGVLQTGKTGSVSGGSWSISNVTVFGGDVVTVFVSGTSSVAEAVGVTRYDGSGDISGLQMYERHVALGSDDATSTPLTNADIGLYNFTDNEDVFLGIAGTDLDVCGDSGCSDARLYVNASTTYQPEGVLDTHDLEINGTVVATGTAYVSGSWDNNATATLSGSTIIFDATSTSETVDSTGAVSSSFNHLTFGSTTGNGTWSILSPLDIDGDMIVDEGTLLRATATINIAGNLTNDANGIWSGTGTTTFDGSVTKVWTDNATPKQDIGIVIIDGGTKTMTLGSNVRANEIIIGADDTLDVTTSHYDIEVLTDWTNNNTFIARDGEVFFNATTSGRQITTGGDAFYDLTFNGGGGDWSFIESTVTINNDLTVATGTVTMPTATTTIAGSFNSAGGSFAHNNGLLYFTSGGAETITASGTAFANVFNDLTFNGSGSWAMNDTNATTTDTVRITSGTVTLPSGYLAIDGSLHNTGGAFTHNAGTVQFTSSGTEVIETNSSSFSTLLYTGTGAWSFVDANVTAIDDVLINAGALTLPSGTLTIGGSLINSATMTHNSGTVFFNSSDSGETVNFGSSPLYDLTFNNATGGWTITAHATATNNVTLQNASDFTLGSGNTLSVAGTFTNTVGGASTTWSGSTLSLTSASEFAVNIKTDNGDEYDTLSIAANTDVSMWNSRATTTSVNASGSLYSQDHASVDGDLNIYGSYERTSGTEHWSYATDFDGADLSGGSERQADVRFDDGGHATITAATLSVVGTSTASTTISSLSGTYTLSVTGGTTTASYYAFDDLGGSGLSLLASTTVTDISDGSFTVQEAGASALTLSSTTIDTNPAKQLLRVSFATTTPISATNVTQTDGAPSSFWWFKNASGNLEGESYDNDTGDPGSIRWDDSSLVVTIGGTVYADAGATPLIGGTCNGVLAPVRVVVEGGSTYDGSCGLLDGVYSIPGVVIVGDPTVTLFLNDAFSGEQATVITKTVTGDVDNMHLYKDRIITRRESSDPLTIADMVSYDEGDDDDIAFVAATGTPDTLVVRPDTSLFVYATTTFTPGGNVTLQSGGTGNAHDGTLHVDNDATFTSQGAESHSVGGRFQVDLGGTFVAASSTVLMTATTTSKNITTPSPQVVAFDTLNFIGGGGEWSIDADITATSGIAVSDGTVIGAGDIDVFSGPLSGTGTVDVSGGETTLHVTNTLGSTTPWTFYDLTLGDGATNGTTTRSQTATTTVKGTLTIATGHILDAGASGWSLNGAGNVFVENGTFDEGTSRVRYSTSTTANILSTTYYDLDLSGTVGTPTYTATGLGHVILNDLTVGGGSNTTVNFDTNDPALRVDGDVLIRNNGTLIGSDSASFTVSGSWDNDGAFTSSGGTVTFDGAAAHSIAAGSSSFGNVIASSTGALTITEHATNTGSFTLVTAPSATVNSGVTLAVGGMFLNQLGGAATTWTGSTLSLYGGGNYEINPKTVSDTYATLSIDTDTDIRMWNSSAATTTVSNNSSLYSQDHTNVDGDLYIFGDYLKTSGNDYWSYATDFDGIDLSGGSERKVDVFFATDATSTHSGGSLEVLGGASASTTIQSQDSGTYDLQVGGNASTSWSYYEVRDIDSEGVVFYGAPTVETLSNGDFLVSQDGGTAITVGGAVIDTNPAKNFNQNIFATSSAISATNVTATGTSVSSWRFTNHTGNLAGESYDSDPGGDPGYVVWDDSAASITISGNVYSDEGSTVSSVCDGSSSNVHLRVAGVTSYTTSCNSSTGAYSIPSVAYSPNDTLTLFIDEETEKGANVSIDPISSIGNMHLYENRVIVRHENTDPISIADMTVWDSSDDADIPFTAVDSGTDTLTLPADMKLIVWNGKEFEPSGNVTVSGGGAGASYDGTFELFPSATFSAQNGESHTVGGSLLASTSASYDFSQSTTTLTTTGTDRTVDTNDDNFYNLTFNGSGSWTIANSTLDVTNDMVISQGEVTLPTGITTVGGSFDNTGGSFIHSSSTLVLNATSGGQTIEAGGSDFYDLTFNGSGGAWAFQDTNATTTQTFTVAAGTVTLPSGVFTVGLDFNNSTGTLTHNNGSVKLTATTTDTIFDANGSDLNNVTIDGSGSFVMSDGSLTFLGDLAINQGTITLATSTLSIGGSLNNNGGSFNHASGTILFNSADTGEIVRVGGSDFYNATFANTAGGWELVDNATSTNNFTITSAAGFTATTGIDVAVKGVFTNSEGGGDTTWTGSTLKLLSGTDYTVGAKTVPTEAYATLIVGNNTDVRLWNSSAVVATVATSGSLYSQDHAGNNGDLYVYGDYHRATGTDYWSYATDFDGVGIGGSERQVNVRMASGATTTIDGGSLQMIGAGAASTTIQNQGSGTYAFLVDEGTINAQYFALQDLNSDGLNLTGINTVITDLSYGDFELAVNGGALITVASTTLNANASKIFTGNRFATTTAITGTNVLLNGTTTNVWNFAEHYGNLDGESFDSDGSPSACGAIRWDDSSCLVLEQTHYRWRNDGGGEGVPDSEWYNASWDKRKRVRIVNNDNSTYSTTSVSITVTYDADMQADFDDLRFTDAGGTTTIPYWIEEYTASTDATVWVHLDTLPASDTATVFMYYDNAGASDASATSTVFEFIDDFEDDDIDEYSGDTSLFNTAGTFSYERSFGLDAAGNESAQTTNGLYRTDITVSQGQRIRYLQYIDTSGGSGDETCTLFGVQGAGDNYAVCLELFGTDRVAIAEDVTSNDVSGTVLASTTITYVTGWHEVLIDWLTDDTIDVEVRRNGTVVATTSASDSSLSSGGVGFSFWFQNGGWDIISAQKIIETDPTVYFGVEQVDGGATWIAAQDTLGTGVEVGDNARVRIMVENSGTDLTGETYRLEFAAKGASPSCEAVSSGNYAAVPVQASCGSSEICMQSSTQIADGNPTTDHLTGASGQFLAGKLVEDPSNTAGSLDIDGGEYTELEYVITPTVNVTDQRYCFRVTEAGAELDAYKKTAELLIQFNPVISALSLNGGLDISLSPGATTTIMATGTVTDLNGYADMVNSSSTIFRSGVGIGCAADDNNCYISNPPLCTFTNCSGNTCDIECSADIYYFAEPTDIGVYAGETWRAYAEVTDSAGGVATATAPSIDLLTLRALNVDSLIDYGSLAPLSDTGAYTPSTTVENIGNDAIDVQLDGTNLTDGGSSAIDVDEQLYATSTFTYSSCTICSTLATTTSPALEVDLSKPVSTAPVTDEIYWGINVPFGIAANPHSGSATFYATGD